MWVDRTGAKRKEFFIIRETATPVDEISELQ